MNQAEIIKSAFDLLMNECGVIQDDETYKKRLNLLSTCVNVLIEERINEKLDLIIAKLDKIK